VSNQSQLWNPDDQAEYFFTIIKKAIEDLKYIRRELDTIRDPKARTIRVQIGSALKVYLMQAEEIETLVNEIKKAREYRAYKRATQK
jgi:hypothetical protein